MSAKTTKWKYPNTEGWARFPFEVNGVKFISLLDVNGDIYPKAMQVPAEVFEEMNIGAVLEGIGDISTMSKDELVDELYRVNEGATQALIVLA